MARYIDLDKVEFLKVDGNKEFNHGVDCCINELLEIEPADVIERSKIDKIIEEVTNLVGYEDGIDTMNVGDDLMISWRKTLEIIKRNIESGN